MAQQRPTLSALLLFLIAALPLNAASWRPVAPEELARKQPKLDPSADAEALFRDVRLLNEAATFGYPHNVITEYIRLKIYTARGKDKYGTVQIPYWGKSIISNVEGRTIRPDGTTVELAKDAIFDKVLVKQGGRKVKVISFAMPGVEPGAIIEYHWTKNVGEFISRYIPLDIQSEYPVDELTFHIKPVSGQWVSWPTMRYMPFGCKVDKFGQEAGGFNTAVLRDIPAFHEETDMPPEQTVKQWVLVYYEENDRSDKDKYWKAIGRQHYAEYSSQIKINQEIRSIANEVMAGAVTDQEKIARLFNYCQKNLKNIYGEEITTQQREGAKVNRTTADTFRQKEGNPRDIDLAFAALATAAGFEARVAELSDRSTFLFNPIYQSAFFLNTEEIALNVNGAWKFYDVTNRSLPPGDLPWEEQSVYALITGPKDSEFVMTPMLNASLSQITRIGDMTLTNDGDLEGNVREIYAGNEATAWRQRFGTATNDERESALRDAVKERFARFELTNADFHVSPDLSKGLSVTYHIKVHGFAQATGKHLFFTPAYFHAGMPSRFSEETRRQPVYFEYPWSEMDTIELQLPQGYALDHADAPAGMKFPIGKYAVSIGVTKTNKLIYRREFSFGTDKLLLFDAKTYPALKQLFDGIRTGDSHLLTLRAEPVAAASVQP